MLNALRIIIIILLWNVSIAYSSGLKNCEWDNRVGVPCITVKGTPNTSVYSSQGVNKQIINKQDIINSGAVDLKDVLKIIPGVDIFQSGPIGQQTSVFTRGSESNHTLVLLNGIPINDQSVTDGLFDFGQDFIQTSFGLLLRYHIALNLKEPSRYAIRYDLDWFRQSVGQQFLSSKF